MGPARRHMDAERATLREEGVARPEADERMFWDLMAFDAIKQWRVVHFPVAAVFGTLALAHILASVVFWSRT